MVPNVIASRKDAPAATHQGHVHAERPVVQEREYEGHAFRGQKVAAVVEIVGQMDELEILDLLPVLLNLSHSRAVLKETLSRRSAQLVQLGNALRIGNLRALALLC